MSQQCDYDDDGEGHHCDQMGQDVVRVWSRSLSDRPLYGFQTLAIFNNCISCYSTDSLPASCSMYSFNFLSWLQVQNRFVTTVSSMLLTVDFKPINYPSMKNHNFIWSLIIQMNIKLSHFQKIEGLLKLKAYF